MKDIELVLNFDKQIEGAMGFVGERQIHSSELVFSGRVFIYCESDISEEEFELLRREELIKGLYIHLRGNRYARERSKLEKPLAFICHDSRDKDIVARPIALGLSNTGWTKVEFNSIFTREIIQRDDFLLPVWHGVTKEEVFNYSPSLADRFGVNWNLGEEEVLRRLFRSII
jgi:hypothetical protein